MFSISSVTPNALLMFAPFTLWLCLTVFSGKAYSENMIAPEGQNWAIIGKSAMLDEAIGIARNLGGSSRVVETIGGEFLSVVDPTPKSLGDHAKTLWFQMPDDAYLSRGEGFLKTVWQRSNPVLDQKELKPNGNAELSAGSFRVKARRSSTNDGWKIRLSGTQGAKKIFDLVYNVSGVANWESSIFIAEIDPTNSSPEIIFDAFSGGAHCCTTRMIAYETGSRSWMIAEGDTRDGDRFMLEDIDGDGAAEFDEIDQSFLYAFEAYAGSWAPTQIMQFCQGEMMNVTFEKQFQPFLRQDVFGMEFSADNSEGTWNSNGFLGAWVAAKSMIGEGAGAWTRMLFLYDRDNSFTKDFCKLLDNSKKECTDEENSFPKQLHQHLVENGYGDIRPF